MAAGVAGSGEQSSQAHADPGRPGPTRADPGRPGSTWANLGQPEPIWVLAQCSVDPPLSTRAIGQLRPIREGFVALRLVLPATTMASSSTTKGLAHNLIWPRWFAVMRQGGLVLIGT